MLLKFNGILKNQPNKANHKQVKPKYHLLYFEFQSVLQNMHQLLMVLEIIINHQLLQINTNRSRFNHPKKPKHMKAGDYAQWLSAGFQFSFSLKCHILRKKMLHFKLLLKMKHIELVLAAFADD